MAAKSKIDTKRPSRAKARPQPGPPLAVEQEQWVIDISSGIASSRNPKNGGVLMLPADEIIRRAGGYRIYNEMLHDDQVKVSLTFKKILVHGRKFEIKPADDSEQAKEIADFVTDNLRSLDTISIFREALSCFDFGYSVGELNWEVKEYKGDLKLMLKSVKHRDPNFLEIEVDNHGNPQLYRQREYGSLIDLQPDKVWHVIHQSRFGNPYGTSDLRAAYRAWWAKKFVINFWNVYLERMGTPTTVIKYPVGASTDLKETLKSILSGLSAQSEILVPQGVEIDLIEAQRAGNPTYEKALQFHNDSIARAILVIGLIGGGDGATGRGADSQSHIQLRTLFKMADDASQNLARSFEQQVIRQLVDFNFEHTDLYPRFIWQDYGEFEAVLVADTIRQLFAAGMIDPDQTDLNYVRSILGMPIREEGDPQEEVIRPLPLPPPADGQPPPAAPQNNERAKKGARRTNPTASRNK